MRVKKSLMVTGVIDVSADTRYVPMRKNVHVGIISLKVNSSDEINVGDFFVPRGGGYGFHVTGIILDNKYEYWITAKTMEVENFLGSFSFRSEFISAMATQGLEYDCYGYGYPLSITDRLFDKYRSLGDIESYLHDKRYISGRNHLGSGRMEFLAESTFVPAIESNVVGAIRRDRVSEDECGKFSKVYDDLKKSFDVSFGKVLFYGTCGEIPGFTEEDIFDEKFEHVPDEEFVKVSFAGDDYLIPKDMIGCWDYFVDEIRLERKDGGHCLIEFSNRFSKYKQ